ncbi:hypothetical protein P3S68_030806 [Capsicum galapagoense]
MARGRVVTGFGGPDMDTLVLKLIAQGWSYLFLQGDHQRRFGKNKVYEFYTNGIAIREIISTKVHGKTINLYPTDLGRILSIPTGGWSHYVKGSWPPRDNLPSALDICRKFSGNPFLSSHRRHMQRTTKDVIGQLNHARLPAAMRHADKPLQKLRNILEAKQGELEGTQAALVAAQAVHKDEKRVLKAKITSLTTILDKERDENADIIRKLTSLIPCTSSN